MERDAKGLAIVIRSIPVRDYDRLLTLFSPSLGLMNVVSYGARKSVRSVKAPLYTEGNFSLEKGRRGWSLKDIDVISTHEGLHDDLDISQSAMLFSDLILVSRTAEPELFSKEEVLGFRPDMGVAVCPDCDTMSMTLILPPNARAYLRRIQEVGIEKAMDLTVSPEQEHRVFRYLLRTLLLSFPEKLRSIEHGIWKI